MYHRKSHRIKTENKNYKPVLFYWSVFTKHQEQNNKKVKRHINTTLTLSQKGQKGHYPPGNHNASHLF